jgi:hypothetical protein
MTQDIFIMLKDRLAQKDKLSNHNGLWARTEVLIGNGPVINNPYGKSYFAPGCPFTRDENMVVVGGAQDAMSRIFGVNGEQFEIPTMYSEEGIGLPDSVAPTESYLTPNGYVTVTHRYGNIVQLFGVGITGTAENDVTVYPVDYRERSIKLDKVNTDGLTVRGEMIPFRYTAEMLNDSERRQYFGKKVDPSTGATGYYLKRFESEPVIKHVWKTGEDVDDETLVSSADIWTNASGLNPIESFTEMILKINRKDVKEWFINLEQEDRTRINTIALFTGEFIQNLDDPADYGDYRDVRMFSKLVIRPQYLDLNQSLTCIYRIYTS